MASEKDKIIAMLEEGTISPDDAAKLLTALGETEHDSAPSVPAQSADPKRAAELKGKKLRVLVEGATDDDGDINVNVAVPLVLAKLVDGIITNVVPKEVNKELKGQGIDLSALKLGE
ncbi:MAG: hypothetical protein LBR72_08770, partial [Oscillospiraceae bacterium]|nr:hypothetical protein [Oscillospiraceae bacterium]